MFTDLSQWMKKRTAQPVHRQLVLITGPIEWTQQQAESICLQLALSKKLWVGDDPQKRSCNNKQYQQQLGSEWDAIIYDAYQGIRANAMAALSGTVRQDGLMFILAPELSHWPEFKDPQFNQRSSYGFDSKHSYFLQWLAQQVQADNHICHLSKNSFKGELFPLDETQPAPVSPYKTQEQQQAVSAIVKVARGKRKRPLVLTADRGRGKSSSLGLAVAELFQQGQQNIVITAPSFATTEQVFQHASTQLQGANLQQQSLHWQNNTLSFYPFDLLLQQLPQADLVLIDEAAAIPTQVLEQIIYHYKRIVFSSTIHGYEGSGRGFELRFKPYLTQQMPDWKALHLKQAIRFADGDPLEQFWFKALLLQNESPKVACQGQQLSFNQYTGQQLCNQPVILQQCFSLLVNAHYQTSPDDLARLLDGVENKLFTLEHQDKVVAVCWVCEEGFPYLNQLQQQIYQGKRRVAGHLLPQNLSYYYCQPEVLQLKCARIVRIAVLPNNQASGLGSSLLQGVKTYFEQQQTDILGSSFAATGQLLNFWRKNGYHTVRLGHKKDASSGEHSAIVTTALSQKASQQQQVLQQRFQQDFADRLATTYRQLQPALVWEICRQLPTSEQVTKHQLRICQQFASGQRPFSFSQPQLKQLLLCKLPVLEVTAQQQQLLIRALLQQHSEKQLTTNSDVKGQKDLEQQLRQCTQLLLSDNSDMVV